MPPELHLHPDRLHDHARTASGLAEDLHLALRGGPAGEGVGVDRLKGAVGAAAHELSELSAAFRRAAAAGIAVDADVSAALSRLRDALDRP